MEEQGAARKAERQIAQFVHNHQVEPGETLRDLSGLAVGLRLLEGINQFDGRQKLDCPAMMFDGLDANRPSDMGFACAKATDQDNVLDPSMNS